MTQKHMTQKHTFNEALDGLYEAADSYAYHTILPDHFSQKMKDHRDSILIIIEERDKLKDINKELLEALKRCVNQDMDISAILDQANAAIAKAEGR